MDAGILTPEALALFLYFVVPGIVLVKVYDLLVPSARREASAAFLDALSYSFMLLAVGFWPYLLLVLAGGGLGDWLYYGLLFVLTVAQAFVVPVLLAVFYVRSRTKGFLKDKVPDPTPTSWDWFFSGKGPQASIDPTTNKPVCYMRFTLKEGDSFGGYFGQYSFASSFPNPAQVYVEEAWKLREDGSFGELVDASVGAVVNLDECELVEFVAIDVSSNDSASDSAENGERRGGGVDQNYEGQGDHG